MRIGKYVNFTYATMAYSAVFVITHLVHLQQETSIYKLHTLYRIQLQMTNDHKVIWTIASAPCSVADLLLTSLQ